MAGRVIVARAIEGPAVAWAKAAAIAGACAALRVRAVRLFDELELVGRPCRRGAPRSNAPVHALAIA
eukprot:3359338-Alexandrium_andersonii.AAC.1